MPQLKPIILFVTHEQTKIGGSSLSLVNLIRGISDHYHSIVIAPKNGIVSNYFRNLGIETHVFRYELSFTDTKGLVRWASFLPRLIRDLFLNKMAIKAIRDKFRMMNVALVHSNSSAVDIGPELAKNLGCVHVWHLREFLNRDFGFNPKFGWVRFRKQIRKADQIICVSSAIASHFELQDSKNAHVIHNAVHEKMDRLISRSKEKYLLFAGGTNKAKGIDDAIRGFRDISLLDDELILKVVGYIEDKKIDQIRLQVKSLGLQGKVEFLGFISNMSVFFEKAQCLLMCSPSEGMGRVTVEAMFFGCPVIGFANAGTLELIKHQETGMLYKNASEIVECYKWLAGDDVRRNTVIRDAFEYAQMNFTEDEYAKKIKKLYQECLAKPTNV
jgi:L-malate glycosyltransferase